MNTPSIPLFSISPPQHLSTLTSFRVSKKAIPITLSHTNFPQLTQRMASSSAAAGARSRTKRPSDSKFIQQQLPACRPVITPPVVFSGFLLISVVFIPIGVASLLASRKVVEIVEEYESSCLRQRNVTDGIAYIQNPATDKTCKLTLNVTKHMKSPIYVYYQLDNFHQNHRRYVKSRSDEQLRDPKEENSTSACKDKKGLNSTIVPCGLIAWSLFNDTYIFSRNGRNLTVNKSGISWKSDREHKFGKDVFPKNFQSSNFTGGAHLNESIPLSEQEDLIVWMRLAALPTFRKLYGRIEVDLNEGESISVTLQNNYNTYSFDGRKKLVLSTAGWLGGKNDFHGIAYLIVGGLCFFLSLAFTIVYFVKPRQLGDPSYLSWNRQQQNGHNRATCPLPPPPPPPPPPPAPTSQQSAEPTQSVREKEKGKGKMIELPSRGKRGALTKGIIINEPDN